MALINDPTNLPKLSADLEGKMIRENAVYLEQHLKLVVAELRVVMEAAGMQSITVFVYPNAPLSSYITMSDGRKLGGMHCGLVKLCDPQE